jgi:hypothetical protein
MGRRTKVHSVTLAATLEKFDALTLAGTLEKVHSLTLAATVDIWHGCFHYGNCRRPRAHARSYSWT